jgi:hypothetical protein
MCHVAKIMKLGVEYDLTAIVYVEIVLTTDIIDMGITRGPMRTARISTVHVDGIWSREK